MANLPQTIADLTPTQKAIIKRVQSESIWIQRLMTLGLVEGTEIEYVGAAIGGDPIEIKVNGASMSIRKECAELFEI